MIGYLVRTSGGRTPKRIVPAASAANSNASPGIPLTQAQIVEILGDLKRYQE